MSVNMKIYTVRRMHETSIHLEDKLVPDQDYDFYGRIVDMSLRRDRQPSIPEKPTLQYLPILQTSIGAIDGEDVEVDRQHHFLFPLSEFKKLEKIELSPKNKAIVDYLVAIKGHDNQFAVVEMSW